jgi:hypothetical protein
LDRVEWESVTKEAKAEMKGPFCYRRKKKANSSRLTYVINYTLCYSSSAKLRCKRSSDRSETSFYARI